MKGKDPEKSYDTATLLTAAAVFIGFVLLLFALPMIMMAAGENQWLAGVVVGAVLLVPFVGLWLRGRYKRRK